MKLATIHYDFWTERQPQPRWAAEARGGARRKALAGRLGYQAALARDVEESRKLQIDRCINAHAGIRVTDGELAVWNLLSFCKNHRGSMVEFLTDFIARNYPAPPSQKRRHCFARKWLARIERDRGAVQLKVAS